MKVRRVDWYFDEWLAGVAALDNDARGVYSTIVNLIYSRGGPIPDDEIELAKLCRCHLRAFRRIIGELKLSGKLVVTSGKLDSNRCESELKRAANRWESSVENGRKGGRPSSKLNGLSEPPALETKNRPDLPRAELPTSLLPTPSGIEEVSEPPASDRLRAEGAPLDPRAPPPEGFSNRLGFDHKGDYRPMLPEWTGTQ